MNMQEVIEAKSQQLAAEIIGEKIKSFNELIQAQSNTLGCSEYQIGLYNGLVLGRSILTGEQPQFYQQKGGSDSGKEC